MSKKANPTLIGVFLLIALGLLVGGLLTFSSVQLFAHKEKFVLYFDASVKGLSPGAPVQFRGVTIGAVKDVLIRFNQAPDDLHMPVLVEIDVSALREKTEGALDLSNPEVLRTSIQRGLRGVLEAQNLVTGLLYVDLRFMPNGTTPQLHQQKPIYKEIPTAATRIDEFLSNLSRIDFAGLVEKLSRVLSRLEGSVSELKLGQINASVTNLLHSVDQLVQHPNLTNTLAELPLAIREIRESVTQLRTNMAPLASQVGATLNESREAMAQMRGTAANLREWTEPDAAFRQELQRTLEQVGQAAQSLGEMAEYLQRNPNALISGRKRGETK